MSPHLPFPAVESLPGFRRQIRLTPAPDGATAAVVDDFHEMVVRITHDGAVITGFASETRRAPFTLCPGAAEAARRTFVGLPLARALASSEKSRNCTHLYDLAALAAAHAGDAGPVVYDVLISDPLVERDGLVLAEIRRDGAPVWQWRLRRDALIAPAPIAGRHLRELRQWIATLTPAEAEAARMLQWCCLMAQARLVDVVTEESTAHMALSCYAFGGEAGDAPRVHTDNRVDFSAQGVGPVAG